MPHHHCTHSRHPGCEQQGLVQPDSGSSRPAVAQHSLTEVTRQVQGEPQTPQLASPGHTRQSSCLLEGIQTKILGPEAGRMAISGDPVMSRPTGVLFLHVG